MLSSQPTMPATSGAQTPILAETTFRAHRYYLLKEMTWQNAEATAVSLGGHLVTINDSAEHEYLWALWGRDHLLWIGLNDVEERVHLSGSAGNLSHSFTLLLTNQTTLETARIMCTCGRSFSIPAVDGMTTGRW